MIKKIKNFVLKVYDAQWRFDRKASDFFKDQMKKTDQVLNQPPPEQIPAPEADNPVKQELLKRWPKLHQWAVLHKPLWLVVRQISDSKNNLGYYWYEHVYVLEKKDSFYLYRYRHDSESVIDFSSKQLLKQISQIADFQKLDELYDGPELYSIHEEYKEALAKIAEYSKPGKSKNRFSFVKPLVIKKTDQK